MLERYASLTQIFLARVPDQWVISMSHWSSTLVMWLEDMLEKPQWEPDSALLKLLENVLNVFPCEWNKIVHFITPLLKKINTTPLLLPPQKKNPPKKQLRMLWVSLHVFHHGCFYILIVHPILEVHHKVSIIWMFLVANWSSVSRSTAFSSASFLSSVALPIVINHLAAFCTLGYIPFLKAEFSSTSTNFFSFPFVLILQSYKALCFCLGSW